MVRNEPEGCGGLRHWIERRRKLLQQQEVDWFGGILAAVELPPAEVGDFGLQRRWE